jgi:Fic family protein
MKFWFCNDTNITLIHQHTDWANFKWNSDELIGLLSEARDLQGKLLGKMESLGFDLRNEALLSTLTQDVLKSSEIEDELLNPEQVRSSIARKLGIGIAGSVESDRNIDGMVEMMLDATQNHNKSLSAERLFDWYAALFPTGRSGMYKITVADWRTDSTGPMQVVSGAMGKEKMHFQAPDSSIVPDEMNQFISWFNEEKNIDLVLKAAVAHL